MPPLHSDRFADSAQVASGLIVVCALLLLALVAVLLYGECNASDDRDDREDVSDAHGDHRD